MWPRITHLRLICQRLCSTKLLFATIFFSCGTARFAELDWGYLLHVWPRIVCLFPLTLVAFSKRRINSTSVVRTGVTRTRCCHSGLPVRMNFDAKKNKKKWPSVFRVTIWRSPASSKEFFQTDIISFIYVILSETTRKKKKKTPLLKPPSRKDVPTKSLKCQCKLILLRGFS